MQKHLCRKKQWPLPNQASTLDWEFLAMSHVISHPIQSVFPSAGWPLYQKQCNRVFAAPGCRGKPKLHIMWTSTSENQPLEHWAPNHFVPIIPKQTLFFKVEGFYLCLWHGKEYVCQVKERHGAWLGLCSVYGPKERYVVLASS